METPDIIELITGLKDNVHQYINDESKKRGVGDIVPSHADILNQLHIHGPMPMSRLAGLINRKKNTLTVLVQKLIKLRYVTKDEDPTDQRVNLIAITEEGRKAKDRYQRITRDAIDKIYQGITPQEKTALLSILNKIQQNF